MYVWSLYVYVRKVCIYVCMYDLYAIDVCYVRYVCYDCCTCMKSMVCVSGMYVGVYVCYVCVYVMYVGM